VSLQEVPPGTIAALFAPERPGPLIQQHVATSGVGRCRADRAVDPRVAVAELPGGNIACRGEPTVVPDLRGLVEAPPGGCRRWPRSRRRGVGTDHRGTADDARPRPHHPVRRLVPSDVEGSPRWIVDRLDLGDLGRAAGLAASGAGGSPSPSPSPT
jgi:hypothetical protein